MTTSARDRYIVLGSLTVLTLATAFLVLFRYDYVRSGSRTDRVDRLTGVICVMPCMRSTASPSDPHDLSAQRAIAAVQDRSDALFIVSSHASGDQAESRYSWSGSLSREAQRSGSTSDDSTFIVCYCKPDSSGFRWETHLKTHEIFYINNNQDLSTKYGVAYSSPSAAPTTSPNSSTQVGLARSASPSEAVRKFYSLLNSRDFAAAYAMTSNALRSGTTFDAWRAGYSTTLSSNAQVSETDDASNVRVTLTARDKTSAGVLTRTFNGRWSLVSDNQGGWLLDDGRFTQISSN